VLAHGCPALGQFEARDECGGFFAVVTGLDRLREHFAVKL
jgi:hypothetical protein